MNDIKSILISACLVLRNEEALVERCLKSFASLVDEIIVVHDGPCTDQTLAICRSYGAKIFEKDFVSIDAHRVFSFQEARGEWILQIDADEFLSPDLALNLRELVKNKDINAYEFLWPLFDGQKYFTKNWPYKRCLVRRTSLSFLALPHFVMEVTGKICQKNFLLEHRPLYNNFTWSIFNKKWRRRAIIQANLYTSDFSQIPKFNYHKNTWPLSIRVRRICPLLVLPLDFLLVFF